MATARPLPHILLITGIPGVGKTTVLRKVAERLGDVRFCGFYTEELREQSVRRGFRLIGFDGSEGVIAHVAFPQCRRVGKYGVDVAAMDRLAEATLAFHENCALYLVDEIGKMECMSQGFVAAMRTLLTSEKLLVATVSKTGRGFIEEVKTRNDVELLEVTHANRDSLPAVVLDWVDRLRCSDNGVTA